MENAIASKGPGNSSKLAKGTATFVDKAASSAHQTVDRIAEAAPGVIDKVASNAHSTVDVAAKTIKPAAVRIESVARKLEKAGGAALSGTREYVGDHPFKTVAGAVVTGMLLSFLFRKRF